jgi:hypothetical protein
MLAPPAVFFIICNGAEGESVDKLDESLFYGAFQRKNSSQLVMLLKHILFAKLERMHLRFLGFGIGLNRLLYSRRQPWIRVPWLPIFQR